MTQYHTQKEPQLEMTLWPMYLVEYVAAIYCSMLLQAKVVDIQTVYILYMASF